MSLYVAYYVLTAAVVHIRNVLSRLSMHITAGRKLRPAKQKNKIRTAKGHISYTYIIIDYGED